MNGTVDDEEVIELCLLVLVNIVLFCVLFHWTRREGDGKQPTGTWPMRFGDLGDE